MLRKILTLCLTVILSLACTFTVFAQDFDPAKTGSVSVTLIERNSKTPIVGANLNVYYVATTRMNSTGNLSYVYTDVFEDSGIDIADPSLATKLDVFVSEHSVPFVKITTDENGMAACNELVPGLYFIRQVGNVEGFAPCTPFVVTIPTMNSEGCVYEVNASPKTEVSKLTSITLKKVWNTDESTKASDSVTVQLLKNGSVIKTAVLNAQNNWQVTYTDMPESDAYSVEEIDVPRGFTATYSQTGYVFTVTNTSTLIQTGQLIWPIPVLSIIGMHLIVFGIALLQKKVKTNA